jgi:methylmalonyl-CoA/ethylmalonyl-CoA epimerase
MIKVEHIGIAIRDLKQAIPLYEKLLNSPCYKTELVTGEQVNTAFFKSGDTKIELLESTGGGAIAKFLESKGEGLHHIAFEVGDLKAEMQRLKNEGFVLLNEEPRKGADNKMICFVHPKSANGVLIELCMNISSP